MVLPAPPKNDEIDLCLNLVEIKIRKLIPEKQIKVCKKLTDIAFDDFQNFLLDN